MIRAITPHDKKGNKNKKTAEKPSDKGMILVWDLLFNLLC